jgi:pyrophosphatase PpaX
LKRYNFVILDWDGNLAKTLDIWLNAIRVVTERRGFLFTDHQLASFFGDFVGLMQSAGVTDAKQALIEADLIAKRLLPEVVLYTGAKDLLTYLHGAGKHTALITSSTSENVRHLLVKHGIEDFFDSVVAADDTTHHKPHPEPLEKALAQLGGVKSEAVIVGDSDKDLGAATNFGIDSILFHEPSHEKFYPLTELQKLHPTHVVSRLEDIKSVIK